MRAQSQHELSASLERTADRAQVSDPGGLRGAGARGGPSMAEADRRKLVVRWFQELSDAGLR
jgi:hypothetical protein